MKHTIIYDTDPGVDDTMALLLALSSPEIEVLGLTTVFGNTRVEGTTRNALNVLNYAGRADIPVAMGADQPMVLQRGSTGEFVHGADGLGNIGWTGVNLAGQKPVAQHAAQFLVEKIMANQGAITLVPVGPLTNIGLALQLEPRIAQNVREVVIMGGNVSSTGNVSPLAEANIHNDPHAASLVFSAPWPKLTMAGLDVTQAVRMDQTFFDALGASKNTYGQLIARIIPFYQQFHRERAGYVNGEVNTHDPSAIAYLIDPSLFESEQYSIMVPTDGLARGATIADRSGQFYSTPKINVLLKADAPRFLSMFKQRLTRA